MYVRVLTSSSDTLMCILSGFDKYFPVNLINKAVARATY